MEAEAKLVEENIPEKQKEFLYNRVENLKDSNAALLEEIDMFERFISHLDPKDLEFQAGGGGRPAVFQIDGEVGGWKRKSWSNAPDCHQLLTLEQKLYVAQREIAEAQKELEKNRKKYVIVQTSYQASIKEAELHLAENKKTQNEFESKNLKFVKDKRQNVKEPEKMLQNLEDKFKINQLEKFKLKNQKLRTQEKKLQQQLKLKIEKAEYEIFFEGYSDPIDDIKLDEVQRNNVKAQQVLNSLKEKLECVSLELTELASDIIKRNQMIYKLEEEILQAEKGRLKAENFNNRLRRQLTDDKAPEIIKYIQAKDKHKRLQEKIPTLQRKVEIAEMALKSYSREWSKHTAAFTNSSVTRFEEHQLPVKLPDIKHNP